MQDFPVMFMRPGDAVTVIVHLGGIHHGTVQSWTNEPGEGFAVNVKLSTGSHQWFYYNTGARFYH